MPAPKCLEFEKTKASGDYKCGDVLHRLRSDFKNKCYICEVSKPLSINVEHFRPHEKNIDLKFSWKNLFWSCAHCNNIKSNNFKNILDCTDAADQIEFKMKYYFVPMPLESVYIHALDQSESTQSTSKLIEAVFNGTTELKCMESENLTNSLMIDIRNFQQLIIDYYDDAYIDNREYFLIKIKSHLSINSSFTSFKRCIIRANNKYQSEFGEHIGLL